MEKMASEAEGMIRLAEDGTVSAGNLEGLVSRVIDRTTDSSSEDERFGATFLTIYQLFSTSVRLFEILKRRFESTAADTRCQYSCVNTLPPGKICPDLLFIASYSSSRVGSRKGSRTKISAVRRG